jgi:hypothetical protein
MDETCATARRTGIGEAHSAQASRQLRLATEAPRDPHTAVALVAYLGRPSYRNIGGCLHFDITKVDAKLKLFI